ncbi:hypothetical protein FOXB_03466 [Fusarium oxysporum f. sp. conglutinans Fo5176]|uniref:Uncharacterized protein n=1 Tax=Fusarium oxysporum (strain Fo5176) TaxID=660025 RepID=F9FAP0_FUSOF|nr:hypothetical protein FOXB_03466 [Fusarium oxysporum f. sp. conglutinans Fo5176]
MLADRGWLGGYITQLESLTCSSAGPHLLPATHFKGPSFADPCSTLESSTAHYYTF